MRYLINVLAFLAATIFLSSAGLAQEYFAITNAKIMTMTSAGVVDNGDVIVRDGKIVSIGKGLQIPVGATVIDAHGGVVTPGLIAADTGLAINEIGSVAATNDARSRSANVSASFDVQYGLNPATVNLPIARMEGITNAVAMPLPGANGPGDRNLFAGSAAMIRLVDAPDILVRPGIGMVVDFDGGGLGTKIVEFISDLEAVRSISNAATPKADVARHFDLSPSDLRALIPVVEGEMPVIALVNRAADIRTVIAVAKKEKLKLILVGAEEGWKVAADIAAANVPVILNPNADLPKDFDRLGATMKNAAMLNAAGVEIALSTDDPTHLVGELRYNAGIAVAHGLPYRAALQAITLNPAAMFGIDGQIGSLAVGRNADLVIWNGDPLEPLTQAIAVFINGVKQPLTSRQLDLARRYAN